MSEYKGHICDDPVCLNKAIELRKLKARVQKLEVERDRCLRSFRRVDGWRDRYRKALEEIAEGGEFPSVYETIATEALKESE